MSSLVAFLLKILLYHTYINIGFNTGDNAFQHKDEEIGEKGSIEEISGRGFEHPTQCYLYNKKRDTKERNTRRWVERSHKFLMRNKIKFNSMNERLHKQFFPFFLK